VSQLHNEEVNYLYGACCTYGDRTGVRGLLEKYPTVFFYANT